MTAKNIIKIPFNIALATYNCLISKPKKEINLLDLMSISYLEEKYPELEELNK